MAKTNDEFKREIRRLLEAGFRESVMSGPQASEWQISDTSSDDATRLNEFFVLTISSQLFRVFLLLHFSVTPKLEALVGEHLKTGSSAALDPVRLYDYLGELGNSICGAMKRELAQTVPSLGMSTPNRLNKHCMRYIQSLDISTETHMRAVHDGDLMFCASAYLVADEELNYHVKAHSHGTDAVDFGELELF
jgi:hypothetical protein